MLLGDHGLLESLSGYLPWLFPPKKPSNELGGPTITNNEIVQSTVDRELRRTVVLSLPSMFVFY